MKSIQWIVRGIFILTSFIAYGVESSPHNLPEGFVYLGDVDPTIIENSRYITDQNFLGHPVRGYESGRIICTEAAAKQLKRAHDEFKSHGYRLVVYDAYRPQRAVDEFVKWGFDEMDQIAKEFYYPTIKKKDVFALGYVAEKSGHSRGSTFDLTLIKDNEELKPIIYSTRELKDGSVIPFLDDNTVDMGSSFDLFHMASHHDSQLIESKYIDLRDYLRFTLKKYGFRDYKKEWWHYTLADEPFPTTYFDFVVE